MPAHRRTGLSRRALLSGQVGGHAAQKSPFRPPWTSEDAVRSACVSCGLCIDACPEKILHADADGKPVVRLSSGECTFCKKCAASCEHGVFFDTCMEPWAVIARVTEGCMLTAGISCQLCTDTCPHIALRLDLSQRPVGAIRLDRSACTGCGACLASCPVGAIELVDGRTEAQVDG